MPDGKTMKNIQQGGCNYPESLETYGVNLEEMKGKIRKNLSEKPEIYLINSRAVPIARYEAGSISWTKMELKELDWKTR